MIVTLTGLLFGLLQGIRHAFEPDHLAAVSTMVAGRRPSRSALLLGAAWGLGHTLTLVLVGGALLLFRRELSPSIEAGFEVFVALMLIVLGARSMVRAFREGRRGPIAAHHHGHHHHEHEGSRDHLHVRRWTLARQPLLIGLVHGLAGSGALTALVLTKLSSPVSGLFFMVLFGVGSTVSMALLTGLLGFPLARAARHPRALPFLLGITGAISLFIGVGWGLRALI